MRIAIMPICWCLFFIGTLQAQDHLNEKYQNFVPAESIKKDIVENPVNVAWISKNLSKHNPRIILTPKVEKALKKQLKSDVLLSTYFQYLKDEADRIIDYPVLERKLQGRRLLGVSRDAVKRIGILSLVYRIEREQQYLSRLEKEMNAVCSFEDWNPSHFLDVAEMSYAVAIGLDWCGKWLQDSTVSNARKALIKHIGYSFEDEGYNFWVSSEHNWNQVCHGGLSAAALVLAKENPDLAAKVINRAVDKLPLAMASYSPHGAYPEGPTYWDYGTSYNLLALSMFESAFGTDFNLAQSPGFMESALYRMVVVGPSGDGFNYSDAGIGRLDLGTLSILTWFAAKSGDGMFFKKDRIIDLTKAAMHESDEPSRLSPAYLIWMSQFEAEQTSDLPQFWKAEGMNPIAIMRSSADDPDGMFLAMKGGMAANNHGNMDVGSFVFELNGVRWSIDPGNQSYHQLETTIGSENLWNQSQQSQRWSLLTKGNQFHSTLTVNGERHNVDGFGTISEFKDENGGKSITIDLKGVFKDQLSNAKRTFIKEGENAIRIIDEFELLDNTNTITWAMMTQAEVTTTDGGVILMQDGKKLQLSVIAPAEMNVSAISLDPPPLAYDKQIDQLKKLAIDIPAYVFDDKKGKIEVILKAVE